MIVIEAVVFDLDGVLIQSEPIWEEIRRGFVEEQGGHWAADAQTRLMGMSTGEWARYLSEDLGAGLPPDQVADVVVARMADRLSESLPLLPGAPEAVRRLATRWPLGLASSSPRRLIDIVLAASGLAGLFAVTISTEEVAAGKPAPDVYLEMGDRLRIAPESCAAVEDSTNGLRSALAAGLAVVAIPQDRYPVDPRVLAEASVVLRDLEDLTPVVIESIVR
jgi:HAD superfamily hydrolase (TIGR01509 family)